MEGISPQELKSTSYYNINTTQFYHMIEFESSILGIFLILKNLSKSLQKI